MGIGFVFFTLVFVWIVSPRKPNQNKSSTYECGEHILGPVMVQFNIRFYVIALIYIICAVEIAVLFPWAVVYKLLGWVGFIEMFVFVLMLLIGLAYLWYHGDLDWVKPDNKDSSD
ncbi:MAG: NADH-quinone oxidoreductase subunit A [Planctomycetes bacterium]|nr:NADH-quinone oxidoreductase subunit A [Planctomycetota bacterium]